MFLIMNVASSVLSHKQNERESEVERMRMGGEKEGGRGRLGGSESIVFFYFSYSLII